MVCDDSRQVVHTWLIDYVTKWYSLVIANLIMDIFRAPIFPFLCIVAMHALYVCFESLLEFDAVSVI